jgi:hypothetical protein
MALTYTQLKQAMQDYLENDETSFTGNLDVFIRQAEDRILKEVQLPVFRKIATSALASGNKYLSLPDDFIVHYALAAINASSSYTWLIQKEPEFIKEAYPDDSGSSTGSPKVYGVWDHDTIIIGPVLDATYTFELHYIHRPTSIIDSGDGTSWLGTNAEMALLNACLVEAYTYLKGEGELLAIYNQRYESARDRLKTFGEGLRQQDTVRRGMFTIQVT